MYIRTSEHWKYLINFTSEFVTDRQLKLWHKHHPLLLFAVYKIPSSLQVLVHFFQLMAIVVIFIPRNTIVAGYYGIMLAVRVSLHPSICPYLNFLMIS